MTDLFKEVRALKSGAISEREQGNYDRSEQLLRRAIDQLKQAVNDIDGSGPDKPGTAGTFEKQVGKEIGQMLGSLGGTYRAWKQFDKSVAAYDEGYLYESSKRYGQINSYNLTQRLVSRVLAHPKEALSGELKVVEQPFADALRDAKTEIERQLRPGGERQNDEYALADRAMVCLLLGSADEADAWRELEQRASTPYVFQATLNVVNDLYNHFTEFAEKHPDSKGLADFLKRLHSARERLMPRCKS